MTLSFVAIWIFVALSIMASDSNAVHLSWKPNRMVAETCLVLAMCLFIQHIILCNPTRKVMVVLDKSFSKLANFSYTLYLTHRITLLLIFEYIYTKHSAHMNISGVFNYISILLMCLLSSWCIYYISERNTTKIKILLKKNASHFKEEF